MISMFKTMMAFVNPNIVPGMARLNTTLVWTHKFMSFPE